jgi:chromosome segregation ATPase
MKRMTSARVLTVLTILGALFFVALSPVFAADENDIAVLENELIKRETALLEPELKLDRLLVDRAKLDGMGGLFQGSKKKALEKQMEECQGQIDAMYREMAALQKRIQDMVFAVAQTYEQKGDFRKAIEYYLKIKNQTDAVKFRLASCHKSLKEYEQAIQWLLKMARTDQNLLEVVDCYRLDGRPRDAIYWLFQILEPFEGNGAEKVALDLIERVEYSGKKTDYPDFAQRLSNVYLRKAVLNYKSDFGQARVDYEKAVQVLAGPTGEPRLVSFGIVSRFHNEYKAAIDMLEQQRVAAERNYEQRLRDAKQRYDETERRYRYSQSEAENEYLRRLDQARRDMERAEFDYNQLQKQASPSAELIDQAQRRVKQTRDNYQYIVQSRQQIIEEHVRPYRREMERAMDEYRDLVSRRTQIIEGYIAPYRQRVADAQYFFEMIRALHEAGYGNY